MGKGSQNTLTLSCEIEKNQQYKKASKAYFTKEEVSKHNQKEDLWIIVNDKVYDVSNFQKIHPGGAKVLSIYAGQDASEVFNAFHKEFDKVNKYSKMYQIGELHPNEITRNIKLYDENMSANLKLSSEALKEIEKLNRYKRMREDFKELRKLCYKMGLFEPSYFFFFLQAAHIVFFQVLGFYILWNYGCSFVPLFCSLMCHIIAQAQSAWTQHDYGHSSIMKKPKHNQYIQMFFLGIIKGASAEWWTYMHNQHHAKPNVIDTDPDVRLQPVFVLGNVQPKKIAQKNASGKNDIFYNYSFQPYIFPFVAPLLFPLFFQITTIRYAINKKRYLDLLTIALMFTIQLGITYPVFGSINKAIMYFLVVRFFESSWFVWVSQSNHIPMDIHEDDPLMSWLNLQLRATCNIEKSFFNDWFTGHLNFQIEHHLFPTMPRHNYYKVQPLVQSLCKKHNVDYIIKPLGTAFFDIILSLKKYGEMWEETFIEFQS